MRIRHALAGWISACGLILAACGSGGPSYTDDGGDEGGDPAAITVAAASSTISADGSSTTTISATVTDSDGAGVSGETVTFSTDSGTLSDTTATTSSSGVATVTLTSSSTAGTATITATEGSLSASTTVTFSTSVSGLNLLLSSTQLSSAADDTSEGVTLTAQVKDSNNNVLADTEVQFSVTDPDSANNSATITPDSSPSETDDSGIATATLTTGGDPTNRTLTVSAEAAGVTVSKSVTVVGTSMAITGASTVGYDQSATYTVTLSDSAGDGVADATLSISSANGNTLSASTVTTDSSGQATFTMTASSSTSDTDTLTVTGDGATATLSVAVSSDSFSIETPDDDTEVAIGDSVNVTVLWTNNGSATDTAGQTVYFSATRGTFSASSATIGSDGTATVSLTSTSAGDSLIEVSSEDGSLEDTATITFVADTPTSVDLQASPANISVSSTSTLTAIVRDAQSNLVAGTAVNFSLSDVTGGSLSAASATTNSQGKASVTYTASTNSSATDGVVVTATVAGTTVSDSADITVGGQAVRLMLGTGNSIAETGDTIYSLPYVAIVTDASGNPVTDADFTLSIEPLEYYKGEMAYSSGMWSPSNPSTCANEDVNLDNILETGEDYNGNGTLDPGNPVSVPSTATLDDTGTASFDLTYPENYAYWVKIRLVATVAVSGTETESYADFVLPGLASDYTSSTTSPPGQTSPYGTDVCSSPD